MTDKVIMVTIIIALLVWTIFAIQGALSFAGSAC